MIQRRYVKKRAIAVLVTSLVIMTLNVFLNPSYTGKAFNITLSRHSINFYENDFKSKKTAYESYVLKSNASIMTLELPRLKKYSRIQENTGTSKCGYINCPKTNEKFINIHLIPHSHNDPGYKKTMDEYFYGLRNDIQNFSVSKILINVVHQLTLNHDRKFIYAEVLYFSKWWKLQTESIRDTVRDLVRNGRFEFINGGWCVNDEANPNYADIIDQMSIGLNFLAQTFGECGRPRVAFQADTFGHSREQALLSSLMGFDGIFMGRVDKEDKNRRKLDNEMEMIWYGSDLPGKHPSIFTGITYNVFDPPLGFCFDNMCGSGGISKPINDDMDSEDYNVKEMSDKLLEFCWNQADAYLTNNVAVYMGSDFTYENAEVWFTSMDKLIRHINDRQKKGGLFNIFYSTPACYLKALNEANVTWPAKKDDFFPYHGEIPVFWTGYYSSRPALKYMVRQGSSLLQACKQMAAVLILKGAEDKGDLSVMKEAMALMQHHDGITGTHSQRVSDDYVRILHKGFDECTKTINSYYQSELNVQFFVHYCPVLNMSQCEVTERKGDNFVVNIYNPLGKYINKYIRVPVTRVNSEDNFLVIDSNGKIVPSQLTPIAKFVASIPGRNSSANTELIFLANKVPPLGSKSYFVETSLRSKQRNPSIQVIHWNSSSSNTLFTDLKISNKKLSLTLCEETGLIASVTILGNKKISLDQQFYWYNGNGEKCSFTDKSASGVYFFNPQKDMAHRFKVGTKNVTIYKGHLVEEIHQTVNEYIGQIIRLYKGQDYIEFDWVVGPIPIEDGIGKEIITSYSTDLKNNGSFYTDSNGRQSILRKRDYRQTYKLKLEDPIASNYYPITSHVFMNESTSGLRMNLLTDRAQGGGSMEDGQLELMIHRRLLGDDICSFKEPLDEMAYGKGLVVRGTHTLFFDNTSDRMNNELGSSTLRSLVEERSRQPTLSFISTTSTFDHWIKLYRPKLQLLSRPLPENVKLLTFEPRHGHEGEYTLRLEHMFDVGEHLVLSNYTVISLKGLFHGYAIDELKETTLDGNLIKSNLTRLSWRSRNTDDDANFNYQSSPPSLDHIKLMPMEIRTFIVKLSPV